MKKSIILFLSLAFSITAVAQSQAKFQKLDSLLNYLYENDRFMGSILIRENENVVFEKAYGFVDFDNKIKANTKTKYKVGSVTKMFTSSIIFQLIEEKKLKLDTKLSKYFPEVKNADKITIAQMLNHKSGIFNYTNDAEFKNTKTDAQTKEAMVKRIAAFEPAFEPDTKAQYSNSNYLLLGYIIENITKKTYVENLNERIINKIGLKDTKYYSKIDPSRNEAYSYSLNDAKKWEKREEWDASQVGAAGALQSTPEDLTKFIKALFDGKIISKTSLAEMTKIDQNYGKGIFVAPFGERKFFTHNGGIEGFTSTVGFYPAENLSFSIIMNGDNFDINDIVIGALSIYYKMPYQFPNLKTVEVDQATLKSYEGIYAAENFPMKITIKTEDGKLTAQATGQSSFPLNPVSQTEFTFEDARVNINFKENMFIFKQGGKTLEFKRESK